MGFSNECGDRWYFDAHGFDNLRHHIEESSVGAWTYDGGSELVVVNALLPKSGDPVLDWESVQSGPVERDITLAIEQIIERISSDLECDNEDAHYGIGEVLTKSQDTGDGFFAKIMIGALGGMLAALGKDMLGL